MRCTRLRRVKLPRFHESGFQPLLKYRLIHRNIGDKPVMADKVKTPFDITLQYPTGTGLATEVHETLFDSISTRAIRAKAIAVSIRRGFRYGFKS
ncbi:conserved hypothetical protein [Vibrio nigripulchritudo MADA3029]|nr:conserved hypothetical protein [Vibrio nigripulchritudo MADA3021]CCN58698.1 conserved hypothetical protein [Vibrio nigripulchritudo MADA3029]